MYKSIFYLVVFIKVVLVSSQKCQYVSKLEVFYDENENKENLSSIITGCLTNTSFSIKNVGSVVIYCNNDKVPVLEKFFINNMNFLKSIYIGACYVETIEPGAFLNLPQIKSININSNRFSIIAEGVFNTLPSLQILYLFNNQVSEVEDNAISNLPHLKEFSLSQNKLKHLKKEWFTNTTNIENIKFFLNLIQGVPSEMFHGWKGLRHLDLSANYISRIDGPLLKDNALYMNLVSLHSNRLRTLTLDTFSEYTFIGYLLVSGNLLNYLAEDFLRNVRVAEVSVSANPFTCPCFFKMRRIFTEKGVIINKASRLTNQACDKSYLPVCGFSSNITDSCVENVDNELTHEIVAYMKEARYDTVIDYLGQRCSPLNLNNNEE